jgi:hypothetical protein
MMPNYKITTGPYKGRVTAEGATVLDVPFADMPWDIQKAIIRYVETDSHEAPEVDSLMYYELDRAIRVYENSWDSEETEDPVDLVGLSVYIESSLCEA